MSDYLISHGWRQIGRRGGIKFWDHPNHQSDTRGAFTTQDAYRHQRDFENDGCCDCIQPEEKH